MQVKEIMTANPACCAPDDSIQDAAMLMAEQDCGEIPVVDGQGSPVGVITDRDIACRAVAQGEGPGAAIRSVMSNPIVTVTPEMSLEDCCDRLEQNQIRRAPVVDEAGICCGIVSQADIARHAPEREAGQFVRELSQPEAAASQAS